MKKITSLIICHEIFVDQCYRSNEGGGSSIL